MSRVTAADLNHPNVRALLRVIRRGEGTVDEAGYRRIFGGQLFEGFADHPRIAVTKTMRNGKRITSTAAGAYQFLSSTWDETARIMGLRGFSPANQDLGAVGRIAARNALEDIKAGRFEVAVKKIAWEWASMPGSPYGQPVISMDTARAVYVEAGGSSY
ncbi:glycoside hydrolase family 104 protein [Comamonas sp. EJ-4]|nr:glycoside hydrolase family 104 protein [Comamonas suwonensis]